MLNRGCWRREYVIEIVKRTTKVPFGRLGGPGRGRRQAGLGKPEASEGLREISVCRSLSS